MTAQLEDKDFQKQLDQWGQSRGSTPLPPAIELTPEEIDAWQSAQQYAEQTTRKEIESIEFLATIKQILPSAPGNAQIEKPQFIECEIGGYTKPKLIDHMIRLTVYANGKETAENTVNIVTEELRKRLYSNDITIRIVGPPQAERSK